MAALSILLPTYNGARFLEEQVSSISAQSFRDWQLFVCDDGSSDATVGLVDRIAAHEPRIVVVPTTGNHGQKRRLHELFRLSESPLVAVSDQDDIWAPDKLAHLVDALGTSDLAFGASWLIDADGRELGRQLIDDLPPRLEDGDRLTYLFRPVVSAHAMIARRSLLAGMSFMRQPPFDWLISLEAVFGNGLVHVPEAKTMHRMHGGNQMNARYGEARLREKLFSRYETVNLPRQLATMRLQFLSLLEHLTYAEPVRPEAREAFGATYRLCREAWFSGPRGVPTRRDLVRLVGEHLRPLSGSTRDLAFAIQEIEHLCRPAFALGRLAARARRVRGRHIA